MTPYRRTVANATRRRLSLPTSGLGSPPFFGPRSRPVVSPLAPRQAARGRRHCDCALDDFSRPGGDRGGRAPAGFGQSRIQRFYRLGLSGWFLVPIGGLLVLIAVFDTRLNAGRDCDGGARARLSFLLLAISLPD